MPQVIGRVVMNHRGVYDPSIEYSLLDGVRYQGSSYTYINSNPAIGKIPTDKLYWELQAEKGEAATIEVGSVIGGNAGTQPVVTNVGDSFKAKFNFILPKGDKGEAATIEMGTTTTGAAGSLASVTNVGSQANAKFDFIIPRGAVPTIEIGSVLTGNAGSNAIITNTGTPTAAKFNFTLPRGAVPTISVGNVITGAADTSASVSNVGTPEDAKFDFILPRGAVPTISIGSVTTGEAGSQAAIINSGTPEAAKFDFTIPRGDTGTMQAGAADDLWVNFEQSSTKENISSGNSFPLLFGKISKWYDNLLWKQADEIMPSNFTIQEQGLDQPHLIFEDAHNEIKTGFTGYASGRSSYLAAYDWTNNRSIWRYTSDTGDLSIDRSMQIGHGQNVTFIRDQGVSDVGDPLNLQAILSTDYRQLFDISVRDLGTTDIDRTVLRIENRRRTSNADSNSALQIVRYTNNISAFWNVYHAGMSNRIPTSQGGVPTVQTASNSVFLRNDNTWATVTPANIGALSLSGGGTITSGNVLFSSTFEQSLRWNTTSTDSIQVGIGGTATTSTGATLFAYDWTNSRYIWRALPNGDFQIDRPLYPSGNIITGSTTGLDIQGYNGNFVFKSTATVSNYWAITASSGTVVGRVYNDANRGLPGMIYENGYWGLTQPNYAYSWIRFPGGILPGATAAKGSGIQEIGSSGWYWKSIFADNHYGVWQGDTLAAAKIPNLDASKITTGTIATARLPTIINSTTTSMSANTSIAAYGATTVPWPSGVSGGNLINVVCYNNGGSALICQGHGSNGVRLQNPTNATLVINANNSIVWWYT